MIHDPIEYFFLTHDESSPPAQFHLAASKVMIVSTPLGRRSKVKKNTMHQYESTV